MACNGPHITRHEFGHALGFAHEHLRSDTPGTCHDAPIGTDGDTTVGVWNLDSVMNYCNPEWAGFGSLSDTDITINSTCVGFTNQ